MNDIVVGVKPIKNGCLVAEVGEESEGAVGAMWMTVDGLELPVDGHAGLISVTVDMDCGPITATVRLICNSVRSVDFRDPEHAPERFTEKIESPA